MVKETEHEHKNHKAQQNSIAYFRVVYGCFDQKAGALGTVFNLHEYALNHKYEVVGGVMEKECATILSNFFAELRKRPKGNKNES